MWCHIKSILIWVNSPFNCKRCPGERLTRYTCIYVELVSNDDYDYDDDDYDDDEASRFESLLEVFCWSHPPHSDGGDSARVQPSHWSRKLCSSFPIGYQDRRPRPAQDAQLKSQIRYRRFTYNTCELWTINVAFLWIPNPLTHLAIYAVLLALQV